MNKINSLLEPQGNVKTDKYIGRSPKDIPRKLSSKVVFSLMTMIIPRMCSYQ